jgi:hypothetical protein
MQFEPLLDMPSIFFKKKSTALTPSLGRTRSKTPYLVEALAERARGNRACLLQEILILTVDHAHDVGHDPPGRTWQSSDDYNE